MTDDGSKRHGVDSWQSTMKWFERIAQGVCRNGDWIRRLGETELDRSEIFIDYPPSKKRQLRRSDIFMDNQPTNKGQLRRSGILGRVAGPEIFQQSIERCGRPDVAPMELGAAFPPCCYKDVALTEIFLNFAALELFLIKKSSLPTSTKGFLGSSQT
jgi:hypothetical protein